MSVEEETMIFKVYRVDEKPTTANGCYLLVKVQLDDLEVPRTKRAKNGKKRAMANITKLEFAALDISGRNYLTWILDAEIHLNAMNLGNTIKDGNEESEQDKERYDHQKSVILPKARYEWMHLRLQDFKSVNEYNSAMFKIVSRLRLCGDDVTEQNMLEKTFTTFHASNMLLQQQYREENNELLMKNHNSHPTGSQAFPEVNANVSFPEVNANNYNRGRGRGRGRGYRRGHGRHQDGPKVAPYHPKWNKNGEKQDKGKAVKFGPSNNQNESCHRCGVKGHWSRACRTPRHLVDLYQASIKGKGKGKEINFTDFSNTENDHIDPMDLTHLDVADFFPAPSGEIDEIKFHGDDNNDGNK
ncbi:PREDICTED: uncharacterized protein LOC105950577 [Erythranthe guttata]|uniref:uncharacterized protein LOC105950577 n=1 Tax=Erythranthe guttata TaxID=4155 RepID=UPI00064D810D|nr:PREDICTED: uncharacterized protein LOC105950577 [Erythranthe guttata]|eukprot:XP_012829397.1 PREDICTED: uncharacterized protein LOC105950577 [Erythranthe guttata]